MKSLISAFALLVPVASLAGAGIALRDFTELAQQPGFLQEMFERANVPPAADAADNPSHDTATTVPSSPACVVLASPQCDPRSS